MNKIEGRDHGHAFEYKKNIALKYEQKIHLWPNHKRKDKTERDNKSFAKLGR